MVASVAITVVESISSAMPWAIFPMILAVAGAIKNTSARLAREMCSTSNRTFSANMSTATACPVRVSKVRGAMNSVACSVIITYTSTPAFRRRDAISADL